MDVNIRNIWVLDVFGVEVWITQTLINTWVIMAILILFALIVRSQLKKFEEIPAKFQNLVETIVELFDKFVKDTVGDERLMFLGNWFFSAFFFILLSNLSGMIGLRPPTADWAVTFAFALGTFGLIQIVGLKFKGTKYLKTFLEPTFVFLPLNIIGELARPISLSFRLFGNVLAGMILISLFYNLVPIVAQFFLPIPLHAFFDIFAGSLQTYIFIALSMTFIAATVATD